MSQLHQKQSLKHASQDYFEQVELTDNELGQLGLLLEQLNEHDISEVTALAEKNEVNGPLQHLRRVATWKLYGFAASILLAVALVWQQFTPFGGSQDMSYLIAKEVAKNHMHLKPLEVSSSNFQKVSDYFSKLDFKPTPSVFLAKNNVSNLLGARYCSIQSVTAAQIRYKNGDGKFVTFYEVGYDADKFGDMPQLSQRGQTMLPTLHYVNGMKVNIWVENGLLMASVVDVS